MRKNETSYRAIALETVREVLRHEAALALKEMLEGKMTDGALAQDVALVKAMKIHQLEATCKWLDALPDEMCAELDVKKIADQFQKDMERTHANFVANFHKEPGEGHGKPN